MLWHIQSSKSCLILLEVVLDETFSTTEFKLNCEFECINHLVTKFTPQSDADIFIKIINITNSELSN